MITNSNISIKKILIGAIITSILVIVGFLTYNSQQSKVPQVKNYAFVGDITITDADIAAKIKLENAYGNLQITQEEALVALLSQFLEQAVAKKSQIIVTDKELADLDQYVIQNSKAPEILQNIKTNLSDSAYKRIYLAPKIVNNKLHEFYNENQDLHKETKTAIEKANAEIQSGKSFALVAQETGLTYGTSSLPLFAGDLGIPGALQPYFSSTNELFPEDPTMKIVKTLSIGETYKDIVEDAYSYQIIRLISKQDDKKYLIEFVSADKKSFDAWLKEEVANINIKIQNSALRDAVKSKYPDVWWLENI